MCVHGECEDHINDYSCDCDDGWDGDYCDHNIDDCASKPCINGECIDDVDSFSCDCDDGWFGELCGQRDGRAYEYRCFDGVHQPEWNIKIENILTNEACELECDLDSQCKSYDFIEQNERCYLQYRTMCDDHNVEIKYHGISKYCERIYYNEYEWEDHLFDGSYTKIEQKHQRGEDIWVMKAVGYDICQARCDCDETCVSFDFQFYRMDCFASRYGVDQV
eukprot:UN27962